MSTWCILLGSPQTRSLMSWVVSEVHCDCVTSFMTASLTCFPCSIPHIQLQPDGSAEVVTERYVEEPNAAIPRTTKTSLLLAHTQGKSRRLSSGGKTLIKNSKSQFFMGVGSTMGVWKPGLGDSLLGSTLKPHRVLHTPFNTPPHLPFPPSFRPGLSYAWIGHPWFRCSLCLLLVWRPHWLPITPWGNMEYCMKSHRAHTNASLYSIDLICTCITEPGIDGLLFWSQSDWGLMSADAASRV